MLISTGLRLRRRRLRSFTRLHVGCGDLRIPGYLNIDVSWLARGADVVCPLAHLDRVYPPGHAEVIYACHVLEHLSHEDADRTLGMFYRLLRPGGELRVSVPDMDRIVRIYTDNWGHFQTPGNSPWIGLIWGGQTTQHDFHRTGFNFCWLKYLLEAHGFKDVQEYPHEPHFLNVVDGSLAHEPFGQFVSVNVLARK
jgi:predicted SAM-dependent methyltransferase